jgi:hypothetical protein
VLGVNNGMLTPLADFSCTYGGEVITLKAGRDCVSEGHELHRRFPNKFGSAPSRVGKPRPAGLRRRSTALSRAGVGVARPRTTRTLLPLLVPKVGTAHDDREIPELRAQGRTDGHREALAVSAREG